MIWKSGARSARIRIEGATARLSVFSGNPPRLVMEHLGSVEYAVGYVLAFMSCPQPE